MRRHMCVRAVLVWDCRAERTASDPAISGVLTLRVQNSMSGPVKNAIRREHLIGHTRIMADGVDAASRPSTGGLDTVR